jgi:hypothetical protein
MVCEFIFFSETFSYSLVFVHYCKTSRVQGVCGHSMVCLWCQNFIFCQFTLSPLFHLVCGHFQVSVVSLGSVCGALTSDLVNLHFLLSFPTCLWSFSGVCGLFVICSWCLNFKFCQFTLPPIISTLTVVVFRCLWSVVFSGVCGA